MHWLGAGAPSHAGSLPKVTSIDRKPVVCDRATPTTCTRCGVPNVSYSCGSGCHRPRTPRSPPECTTNGGGTPTRTNQHRSPESVTGQCHIGHGFCPRAPLSGSSAGRFVEMVHARVVGRWSQCGSESAVAAIALFAVVLCATEARAQVAVGGVRI